MDHIPVTPKLSTEFEQVPSSPQVSQTSNMMGWLSANIQMISIVVCVVLLIVLIIYYFFTRKEEQPVPKEEKADPPATEQPKKKAESIMKKIENMKQQPKPSQSAQPTPIQQQPVQSQPAQQPAQQQPAQSQPAQSQPAQQQPVQSQPIQQPIQQPAPVSVRSSLPEVPVAQQSAQPTPQVKYTTVREMLDQKNSEGNDVVETEEPELPDEEVPDFTDDL